MKLKLVAHYVILPVKIACNLYCNPTFLATVYLFYFLLLPLTRRVDVTAGLMLPGTSADMRLVV